MDKQVTIQFSYTEGVPCQLDKEPFFQCCCQCIFRRPVNNSCGMGERHDGKCICNDHLGFYVCAMPIELLGSDRATLIPEHSCGCEAFLDKRQNKKSQLNRDEVRE